MKKNKWFLNGGRGSGRTFRLICETYENKLASLKKACDETQELLDKQIEATFKLDKENAELKEENQKWKDEWQEQVQKATDEGYARTLQTIQLTKAKEIIKELCGMVRELNKPNVQLTNIDYSLSEAEQFLNSEAKK